MIFKRRKPDIQKINDDLTEYDNKQYEDVPKDEQYDNDWYDDIYSNETFEDTKEFQTIQHTQYEETYPTNSVENDTSDEPRYRRSKGDKSLPRRAKYNARVDRFLTNGMIIVGVLLFAVLLIAFIG